MLLETFDENEKIKLHSSILGKDMAGWKLENFSSIVPYMCRLTKKMPLLTQPHLRLRDFLSFNTIACLNLPTFHEAETLMRFSNV